MLAAFRTLYSFSKFTGSRGPACASRRSNPFRHGATDAQGAAVPNAKVSASNNATNVSTSTTANSVGAYTIPNLIPGDYEASAEAPGFSKTVSKVTLTVGGKQEMNFAMTVGQVTQTVEVTGAAPQVELASSTISGVVESTQIVELPLNGRDWAALAQLQPGVAQVRTQEVVTQPGGDLRGLGTQMTVDGNRPTQNVYRLNGIIINDYSNAGPGNVLGANMGVDAIQEFSVLTTNYSGEYGYTSGGVINAVMKSGTDQFHGDAYEFLAQQRPGRRQLFPGPQRSTQRGVPPQSVRSIVRRSHQEGQDFHLR